MLLQQQIISLQQHNSDLQDRLLALSGQIPIHYPIQGTTREPGASGELLYYPNQHMTLMVIHGLQGLSGDAVYQGWLLRGEKPQSIGLFNVENGVALLGFPGDVTGFDAA